MTKLLFLNRLLFILLSVALAFGSYNPFMKVLTVEGGDRSMLVNVLCILIIIISIFNGNLKKGIFGQKYSFVLLFLVFSFLYISSLIYSLVYYTDTYLNIKFLVAIVLFTIFHKVFSSDRRLLLLSLLTYSITLSLIALVIQLGFFNDAVVIEKGRLILFGENPNSYSTRVVLAVFILMYFIYENPLNMSHVRFLFALFLPGLMYLIILSGSRGSFLLLIIGLFLLSFFSPFSKKVKLGLIISFAFILILGMTFIMSDSHLYDRLIISVLEGETAGRSDIWIDAFQVIEDNLIIGVGEVGYQIEMFQRFKETRDAHNVFIYILCCGGILALFPFLAFYARILYAAFRVRKKSIYPLTIVIILLLLMLKTGGVLTYLVLWFFLAAIAAQSNILKNE